MERYEDLLALQRSSDSLKVSGTFLKYSQRILHLYGNGQLVLPFPESSLVAISPGVAGQFLRNQWVAVTMEVNSAPSTASLGPFSPQAK